MLGKMGGHTEKMRFPQVLSLETQILGAEVLELRIPLISAGYIVTHNN
jgi:hypothetical protein